jgi:hypothetical protein
MTVEPQQHSHPEVVHTEKHFHVTHYMPRGENWTHVQSTHTHEHNHPEVEHVHVRHDDPGEDHHREAHIHDHARPAQSPA